MELKSVFEQIQAAEKAGKKQKYSAVQLFKRMAAINSDSYTLYVLGIIAAIATGAVYPAFGIVFCESTSSFCHKPSY